MSEVIKVGMADLNVCKAPDVITTLGLGSCIGLVLYDPVTKVGGMVHYMLPDSTKVRNNSNIAKFGDTGIRELLKRVVAAGASKPRLIAKIAGGARMFEVSGLSDVGNIGARNAEASPVLPCAAHFRHGAHQTRQEEMPPQGITCPQQVSDMPLVPFYSNSPY